MAVRFTRAEAWDFLLFCNGCFVGELNATEMKVFEVLIAEGFAIRQYAGTSGLLGLAKVKIILAEGMSATADLLVEKGYASDDV